MQLGPRTSIQLTSDSLSEIAVNGRFVSPSKEACAVANMFFCFSLFYPGELNRKAETWKSSWPKFCSMINVGKY